MSPEGAKDEFRSRRTIFENLEPQACTHAGLWLERYAQSLGGKGGNQPLFDAVCGKESRIRVSPHYRDAYERRKKILDEAGVYLGEATVRGRMVVGLGVESVLETSIVLHRTYGVPVIPGSALKGLASSAACRLFRDEGWQRNGESHKTMFGDTTTAGYVTFYDAMFVPSHSVNSEKLPLDLDVMTVHHREYYGTGKKPPADWDSPVPVPFLTAHGKYLIAIEGPEQWALAAWDILKIALAEEGIGAKTAAGYGRMDLDDKPTRVVAEKKRADDLGERIARTAEQYPRQVTLTQMLDNVLAYANDDAAHDAIRAAMTMLYAKYPLVWDEWQRNPNAPHRETLEKLAALPPPPAVVAAVDAQWERGSGWIARDSKNRATFFFLRPGEKKPEDRNTKDVVFSDETTKNVLDRATQKQPVAVEVLRDGKKVKQVRRGP